MSSRESYTSVINRKAAAKQQLMNVAMGRERADLVLKNAVYVNAVSYTHLKSHMKGPRKRTSEDDEKFAQSFEKMVLMAQENED